MEVSDGRIAAKSGAEGLICLAVPERELGIAVRVADGSFRAHPAIVVAALEQLDILDAAVRQELLRRHSPELRNHNGRLVGEIQPAFQLQAARVVA
jgi:L-asparaginase II